MSERPAVLVVTHNFIRNLEDQAGQFIYTLIAPIKDRYRFIVIAPHGPGLPLREEIGGIEVVRFRYADDADETLAYVGDMHEQVLRSWKKRMLFLRFLRAMRRETAIATAREKPVAMHIHWWIPGGLAVAGLATKKHVPYILTTHGSDVTLVSKFSWLKPVARVLFKRAAARTSVSAYLQSMLKDTLGVDSHVLPMPYDETKFSHQPLSESQPPIITCIGRFIERKGQKYLLEAGKLLAERAIKFRIQLVGDGPMHGELEKLATTLSIADRVIWTGNVPHSEIPAVIRSSAAVVLPSVLDWKKEAEGLGMVLVEASACGRPVVGTRLGGILDAIDDGRSGLLVEPCSAPSLADALASILTDPQMRTRLGQGGVKFVRANFSAAGQAEKLATLIEQIRGRP